MVIMGLWVAVIVWGLVRFRPRWVRGLVAEQVRTKRSLRRAVGAVLLRQRQWADNLVRQDQVGGVVLSMPLALVWPPLALVAGLGAWWQPLRQMRLVEQKQRQAVVRELPDVVDLFALSFSAGLTVPLAARAVGEVGHGLVAESIRMAADQVDTGLRWSEALRGVLDDLGDPVRRLIRLLLDMLDGTDPGGIIEQIAVEARRDRQRRAEVAARRVPVRLLFPLVTCILPAFGLLTVVPLVAGSFQSLTA